MSVGKQLLNSSVTYAAIGTGDDSGKAVWKMGKHPLGSNYEH